MSSHSLPAAASRCPVVDGAAFDPLGAQECRDPMPWLRPAQHGAPVFFIPRYNGLAIGLELLAQRRGLPLHTIPAMVEMIDSVGRVFSDDMGLVKDLRL